MAVTLAQIREGLALNLTAAITDAQVSAYMLSQPTPPALHVYPGSFGAGQAIEYDIAFHRGLDRWHLIIQAFVGAVGDKGPQLLLDQFMAPAGGKSVKAAVEADRQLGGLVQDTVVTSCTGYRTYVAEGRPPVLGCEWAVEVLATGT